MTQPREKIVLFGMMSRHPVAGIVWLTMQYLIGLKRLGYDVYYVEVHGTPAYVADILKRFDFDGQWAVQVDGQCSGLSDGQLAELYRSAALLINLHGCTKPLPEHSETGRLIYIGTDPVEVEVDLLDSPEEMSKFLAPHCAFFTWGENLGRPDCRVPAPKQFSFRPTRQPVVMDLWQPHSRAGEAFTTIGNWQQPYREVEFQGETYHWSKHFEFLKFVDLPRRTNQVFELSLGSYSEADGQLLESHGWQVRPAAGISCDPEAYRRYIVQSRGEFTVVKDQYGRMRTGWVGDRSPTYLAAGKPVVLQETGFSNFLPTGAGLFAFSTMEEILDAIARINSDYTHHARAASRIAREYFSYDVVLPRLLAEVGL